MPIVGIADSKMADVLQYLRRQPEEASICHIRVTALPGGGSQGSVKALKTHIAHTHSHS